MTIRDIIKAFTAPNVDQSALDLEIFVVTGTETFDASKYPHNPVPDNPKIQAGSFDGATLVKCKPIEGITFGGPNNGFMIFIDPRQGSEKKSLFLLNAELLEKFPNVAICGTVPKALKK